MLFIAAVLALLLAPAAYDERRASRACDDFMQRIAPTGNMNPVQTATEWKWRNLEWECVYTDMRTGRAQRIDVDEARSIR
jgi:hypothetical protein